MRVARAHLYYDGGSEGARELLKTCAWPAEYTFSAEGEDLPHLSDHIISTYDVIQICRPEDLLRMTLLEARASYGMYDDRWTPEYFREELGFDTVSKNTVVVEPDGTLLAVYSADVGPSLGLGEGGGDADLFSRVYSTFKRVYSNPQKGDQNGIFMSGNRICPFASKRSGSLDGTYYVYKKGQSMSKEEKAEVVRLYSAFQRVENAQVPSIARCKLEGARRMGFPGLFPGLPNEVISSPAVGIGRGYTSGLHSDGSTIESIFWNSKGIPDGKSYCFTLYETGLLFDLKASHLTSIIFPAIRWHGTCRCITGQEGPHLGMGAALITKENTIRPKSKAIFDALNERLALLEAQEPGCTTEGDAAFLGPNFRVVPPPPSSSLQSS
jgi:hypothetical protein